MEQEDLTVSEGDSVNLTIFYVKNDPLITLTFNLLFGGNATGILYTKTIILAINVWLKWCVYAFPKVWV